MRLITRVTSLDTSSMLLKRFPRSGFFNFGNKSKAGGLMWGLYGGWRSTCHPYFSKVSDTAPEAWGRALIYDRWSLREIWLQSVPSSISRFHFAEQGPRSLPIRTQRSLLNSGSQLSRKSERFHHPTGRASAVCRTFEMTHVKLQHLMWPSRINTHLKRSIKNTVRHKYINFFNSHYWNSWRIKYQLDVTCYFISLLMCSTCFGH